LERDVKVKVFDLRKFHGQLQRWKEGRKLPEVFYFYNKHKQWLQVRLGG